MFDLYSPRIRRFGAHFVDQIVPILAHPSSQALRAGEGSREFRFELVFDLYSPRIPRFGAHLVDQNVPILAPPSSQAVRAGEGSQEPPDFDLTFES